MLHNLLIGLVEPICLPGRLVGRHLGGRSLTLPCLAVASLADGVAAWGRLDVSLASFVLDRAWARSCGLAERCWDLMRWLQPRGLNAGSGKLV